MASRTSESVDVPPAVAVLNTSDDTVELLRIYLENEGFVVISAHVAKLRRGELALEEHIAEHDPKVVIYDLAPPYDKSWMFLKHIRNHPSMKGRPFVLTSTHPKRVFEMAAEAKGEAIHEIIGKPYDLREIVTSVKKALGAQ
jgi:response regulator RpfG family c-di-GMP phosphodiesterase